MGISQGYKVRHLVLKQQAQRIMSKISKGYSRQLFEQVTSLSAPAAKSLPSGYGSDEILAGEFATFFEEKVDRITADCLSIDFTSGELCPRGGLFR